jgi:hypothetical protein
MDHPPSITRPKRPIGGRVTAPKSEYEWKREETMKKNEEMLRSLGLTREYLHGIGSSVNETNGMGAVAISKQQNETKIKTETETESEVETENENRKGNTLTKETEKLKVNMEKKSQIESRDNENNMEMDVVDDEIMAKLEMEEIADLVDLSVLEDCEKSDDDDEYEDKTLKRKRLHTRRVQVEEIRNQCATDSEAGGSGMENETQNETDVHDEDTEVTESELETEMKEKKETIQIPEFRVIESYDACTPTGHALPPFYVKWEEPTDSEYFELIEYEMDEEDEQFLEKLNQKCNELGVVSVPATENRIHEGPRPPKRKKFGKKKRSKSKAGIEILFELTDLRFMVIMDLLEKEAFALRYFNPISATHKELLKQKQVQRETAPKLLPDAPSRLGATSILNFTPPPFLSFLQTDTSDPNLIIPSVIPPIPSQSTRMGSEQRHQEEIQTELENSLLSQTIRQMYQTFLDVMSSEPEYSDEDAPCCVCSRRDFNDNNLIVFCDGCDIAVHQECYGVFEIPYGDWFCDWCEWKRTQGGELHQMNSASFHGNDSQMELDQSNLINIESQLSTPSLYPHLQLQPKPLTSPSLKTILSNTPRARGENKGKCCVCPNIGGALKRTVCGNWIHSVCVRWIPFLSYVDRTLKTVANVDTIPSSMRSHTCYLCKQSSGVCIQCKNRYCSTSFHAICGIRAGLYMIVKRERMKFFPRAYCGHHSKYVVSQNANIYQKCEQMYVTAPHLYSILKRDHVIHGLSFHLEGMGTPHPVPDSVLSVLFQYWFQKRQNNHFLPLVRRLQQRTESENAMQAKESSRRSRSSDVETFLSLIHLRRELDRGRLLVDLIKKRENLKRKYICNLEDIFEKENQMPQEMIENEETYIPSVDGFRSRSCNSQGNMIEYADWPYPVQMLPLPKPHIYDSGSEEVLLESEKLKRKKKRVATRPNVALVQTKIRFNPFTKVMFMCSCGEQQHAEFPDESGTPPLFKEN